MEKDFKEFNEFFLFSFDFIFLLLIKVGFGIGCCYVFYFKI